MTWRSWADLISLEVRYAVRWLAKNPSFALVASLSLALGIGVTTAAFSVLYAVLLRALPVRDPGARVVVSARNPGAQYSNGVIANAVSRRTKELGIRLALGAGPRRIVGLVLREAGLLALLGVAAGVPCALLIGRGIRSLLFGVQQSDWRSMSAGVAVLLTVAVVAAWLPARCAARVDPLVALRAE